MRGPKFPEGDTLVIADTIKARCGKGDYTAKRNCYMTQLLALRAQRGTRFAMGTLNRLSRPSTTSWTRTGTTIRT